MSALVSIDGAEFARRGECLEGTMPLAGLLRLQDVLTDTDGEVSYRMAGRVGRDGKPCVDIEVAALLHVTCQRCLQAVEVDVESARRLVFVPGTSLGDFDGEEEDTDYLPAEDRVSPVELVVDELLLALPISPRHPEGECPAPLPWEAGDASGGQSIN